jgi:phenylalanine-4-hydroxylase
MRTPYRIDDFQQVYFVIPSIQTLQEVTLRDFGPLYDRLAGASDLGIAEITSADRVITVGSQAYAKAGGRLASAGG